MNQLNNLTSSWKKSFDFFKWSDLKISLFITLNTFIRTSKILFKNFKHVLCFFFLLYLLNNINNSFNIFPYIWIKFTFLFISFIVFFFIILLTIRPSTDVKNTEYYLNNFKKLPGFVATISIIAFIFTPKFLSVYFTYMNFFIINVLIFILILILTPLLVTASLFFLDSEGTIKDIFKAILNSLKMMFFSYPIFLVLGITSMAAYKLCLTIQPKMISISTLFYIQIIFNLILTGIEFILFTTISILFLSLISTFYLKIKHNNHKRFFK